MCAIAPEDKTFPTLLIPRATLKRRRAQKVLSPAESELLGRLAQVWAMALDVYKDEEMTRRFLHEPHALLHGKKPIDLARANAFAFSGLHALAIPIQRRVIAIDPRNDFAYWMLTWSSMGAGQFEEAIEIGNTSLTLFGDNDNVREWMARAAVRLGDDGLAREHYERLTQALMAPSTDLGRVTWAGVTGLLYAGAFYDRAGERDRAEALWQRGVELVR